MTGRPLDSVDSREATGKSAARGSGPDSENREVGLELPNDGSNSMSRDVPNPSEKCAQGGTQAHTGAPDLPT